ncbi:MAG: hypothetical protein IPK66_04105 [Rhodospirillales bacterium]|nr:hypothetical protein [Rhodospirillales bacterium]
MLRSTLPVLLIATVATGGCAEAVQGSRVVTYTPDRFYVRYVPWRNSTSDIEHQAGEICQAEGKQATLESAQQFTWLDTKYATFKCTSVATEAPGAAPAPG